MKKELRGRSTNDYQIEYITNLRLIIDSNTNLSDEEIIILNNEYGCDYSGVVDEDLIIELVRESILAMNNNAITPEVMLLYSFLVWFKQSAKKIEKLGDVDERQRLLNFESALDMCATNKLGTLVSQKYDKDNVGEYIEHQKYKMLSLLKDRIVASDASDLLAKLEHNINAVIDNCLYLKLIDENYIVDSKYLIRWEYYPVDKIFRDVVNTFDSEISKSLYKELSDKEYLYFNKIKKAEVDFSSIKALDIFKEGKIRKVYIANKAIDQAALIYLSKRLNKEFNIVYPNRDKIMELSFNLIDSLPRLDNYTIFKFDFKDFFNSVDIKSIYQKYIEHSNFYTYEKELILKIAKKFKYCVQGLPTSNAFIEIISRDFDDSVKAEFSEYGLVFYKRYVDDCILIFNHGVDKEFLTNKIKKCVNSVFGKKVVLSPEKTSFQTKYYGDESFDYLGYSFTRRYWDKAKKRDNYHYYFEFGMATHKIEKYKKQLDSMFNAYESDKNERLLLRRIQYYDSRIVFYNYKGSKYVNKSTWDVRGIINSYRMLRRYVIFDDRNIKESKAGDNIQYRIEKETYKFLQYYIKEKRDSLSLIPQYLQGKGCYDHNLWSGFVKNKSIVFQPNIGWSNDFLSNRLIEIGGAPAGKSYYEKTRDYYSTLIKKL